MRLVIWGTGNYYKKYVGFIKQEDILYLVDSNPQVHEKMIDGKRIYNPIRILTDDFDYVVILVKQDYEIKKWLSDQGINEEKIKDIYHLEEILSADIFLPVQKKYLSQLNHIEEQTVLICIPNFSRSGVPIVAKDLSCLLKKMGISVLLAGEGTGTLEKDLMESEVEYLTHLEIWSKIPGFYDVLKQFSVVILCSTIISEFGTMICEQNVPIMWWLHESDNRWYQGRTLPTGKNNVHYYGVGQRVIRKFHDEYPSEKIEEFRYYLPDNACKNSGKNKKTRFAIIGSIDLRKAQDVLIEALSKLDDFFLRELEVFVIGKGEDDYVDSIKDSCRNIPNIYFTGELSQREVIEYYRDIDVVICPSRDDPLPIVVTQALQNGIPCIVSDQIGQSEFLSEYSFGKAFENENVVQLASAISEFVKMTDEEWKYYSREARSAYEHYFAEEAIKEQLKKIISCINSEVV